MSTRLVTDAPSTRLVNPKDWTALTGVLARAFCDDPLMRWALPEEQRCQRWSPAFFRWSLQRLAPMGVSWTNESAAGAALWAAPGQWKESPREALSLVSRMALGVGRRAPTVLRGLAQVEALHPDLPHLYLAVLGVEPSCQGTGVGSALLRPGLAHADARGLPAYLETASAANVPFYERHGFAVTGEHQLPKGPPIWLMWRDPR